MLADFSNTISYWPHCGPQPLSHLNAASNQCQWLCFSSSIMLQLGSCLHQGRGNAGAIAELPLGANAASNLKYWALCRTSLEAGTLAMYCYYAPNLHGVSACLQDIRFIYSRLVWTVGGAPGSGGGFDGRFSAFAILMFSYLSLGYWRYWRVFLLIHDWWSRQWVNNLEGRSIEDPHMCPVFLNIHS